MLYLGIGLFTLVGYIMFDRKFPKRPVEDTITYEMNLPIIYGDQFIQPPVKSSESEGVTEYDVICSIEPCKALLIDGCYYDMKVPAEYRIKAFRIGVNTEDHTIRYIELGPNQYHVDKCPKTGCFHIRNTVQGEVLTDELMREIMAQLMIYDLENPMSFGHWENEEFKRLNSNLLETMKKI